MPRLFPCEIMLLLNPSSHEKTAVFALLSTFKISPKNFCSISSSGCKRSFSSSFSLNSLTGICSFSLLNTSIPISDLCFSERTTSSPTFISSHPERISQTDIPILTDSTEIFPTKYLFLSRSSPVTGCFSSTSLTTSKRSPSCIPSSSPTLTFTIPSSILRIKPFLLSTKSKNNISSSPPEFIINSR